jgi:hypothetical protein
MRTKLVRGSGTQIWTAVIIKARRQMRSSTRDTVLRSSIFFSLIFMIQTNYTYVDKATFMVYVSCSYAQHTKLNYYRERLTGLGF